MSMRMCGKEMEKSRKGGELLNILNNNVREVSQEPETTDKQIVQLQDELTDERKSRKTERFSWIMAGSILLDCLILPPLSGGICTFVMVLQMILLLTLANAYELELPTILLRKVLNKLGVEC